MAKQVALGTILNLDATSQVIPGTTYTPIVCVSSLTPPARDREEAEDRCLGDALDVPVPAGEAQSEMTFVHTWHPQDTDDTRLITLFDSGDVAAWQILYPHDDPATYDEFVGYVRNLSPQTLEPTGVYRREVIVRRTGPMSSGVVPAGMMAAVRAARAAYAEAMAKAGEPAAPAAKVPQK